jgi:chromosomal replication initiator protein
MEGSNELSWEGTIQMQSPTSESAEPIGDRWERVLDTLRTQLPSQQAFETWFRPLRLRRVESELIELEVPNLFFVDWIQEHYFSLLNDAVTRVTGTTPQVRFLVCPELEESPVVEQPEPPPPQSPGAPHAAPRPPLQPASAPGQRQHGMLSTREPRLNPNYTFANFVVGSSNQLTHAACRAVAEHPGYTYNPLFIYGGVGLGKTHLMHAIGHTLCERRPESRALYISAERFMNEMIYSIQTARQLAFREKYRNADLLLIDDIQFLAGKDGTQEEFFYTFGSLYEAHRQIVVTSDKPPKDIQDLEERLVSRFNQGLVTDIKPPDMETRVAILKRRASNYGYELDNDVALRIASQVRGNVRDLEGVLVRLTAITSLAGTKITLDLAEEVLRDFASPELPTLTPDRIAHVTADHFGVSLEALRGKRRTSNITQPRQTAMFLMRTHTSLSLADIGSWFRRDHTTVLYACEKIDRQQSSGDTDLRGVLRSIREKLGIEV